LAFVLEAKPGRPQCGGAIRERTGRKLFSPDENARGYAKRGEKPAASGRLYGKPCALPFANHDPAPASPEGVELSEPFKFLKKRREEKENHSKLFLDNPHSRFIR
jgi:hypothetical protein